MDDGVDQGGYCERCGGTDLFHYCKVWEEEARMGSIAGEHLSIMERIQHAYDQYDKGWWSQELALQEIGKALQELPNGKNAQTDKQF